MRHLHVLTSSMEIEMQSFRLIVDKRKMEGSQRKSHVVHGRTNSIEASAGRRRGSDEVEGEAEASTKFRNSLKHTFDSSHIHTTSHHLLPSLPHLLDLDLFGDIDSPVSIAHANTTIMAVRASFENSNEIGVFSTLTYTTLRHTGNCRDLN